MAKANKNTERILLKNAILVWPHLYEKQVYEGEVTKYKGTFLVDKKDPVVAKLKKMCMAIIKENGVTVKGENWCIQNGDDKESDDYHGKIVITAGSHDRPQLFIDKTISIEDNGDFYPGARVNALISCWLNVRGANRIVGQLHTVRKVGDGDRIGQRVSDDQLIRETFEDEADEVLEGIGDGDVVTETDPDDIPF